MISTGGTTSLGLYDFKKALDDFGRLDYWVSKPSGYKLHERALLLNGEEVKSTISNNTADPNVDMTGWKFNDNTVDSIADLLAIENPKDGMRVFVKSFHVGLNLGGSDFFAKEKTGLTIDNILTFPSSNPGLYWVRTNYATVTPLMAGAVGDGVYDDTDGIQKCVNVARYIDMRYRNWNTISKISIPSYRSFNLYGSNLSANNADDAIFEFAGAGDNIRFDHGGGVISGTADSFLKCTGSTTTPTSASHYARQIRLDGLYIVSPTIDKFLDLKDAVRQVFIDKVHAYTKNGISAVGKCVEVKATKSIIYGATDEAGTYGLKLNSPAGTSFYNEGFHFTDCTIDNFNTTFDVTDIYALSVTGGHIGRSQISGSVVAKFGQPNSTHCKDIKFTGVNINGSIVFSPSSGCAYYAQFTGCVSEGAAGANIDIKPASANIKIADHTFHTSNGGVAVVCSNGTNDISVNNISCDTTFIGGVQVLGSAGTDISIDSLQYSGTGNAIYLERPVRLANVPINDATKDYIQTFNASSIQGSHAVGANIASVNNWFAKGETGVIVCELTYTGASASQVLVITTPAGMSIPSGTGWSSGAIMLNTVDGRVSLAIPYIVTQDIPSGSITLRNDIGNTISLGDHSYFGFKRN